MKLLIFLILYAGLSIVVATQAKKYGLSFTFYLVLSLLLGPLLSGIWLMIKLRKKLPPSQSDYEMTYGKGVFDTYANHNEIFRKRSEIEQKIRELERRQEQFPDSNYHWEISNLKNELNSL